MAKPESGPQASFAVFPLQGQLLAGPRARVAVLVVGCVLLVAWQALFASMPERLDRRYVLFAATGARENGRFVYFHYYLGLFPIATTLTDLDYSRAGALMVLEGRPETLLTEVGHTTRFGELGVTWLYLPAALWRGSAAAPTLRPANGAGFILALLALFVAFWWAGQPILGGILVVLLGSNPFQLHEVYARENVFGWAITTVVASLAACVPLLGLRRPWRGYPWVAAAAVGIGVGVVRQFRPEPMAVLVPAAVCLLAAGSFRWRVRIGAAAALLVVFVATSWGCEAYFQHKVRVARARVLAVGGHPFPGPRDAYHRVWNTVWTGLGDFDGKHGYRWDDIAAFMYAEPVLAERYGITLPPWFGTRELAHRNEFWDADRRYYRTPLEVPHYYEVVREKVLHDIATDPLWYAGILARRAWRVLAETSPVRLALGPWWITVPMHGMVALAVVAVVVWARAWPWAKLLGFTLVLSLPALIIYSGRGQCLYSCYHMAAVALAAAAGLEGVLWYRRWREKAGAGK
ncbi:hypothetical protein ACFL09_01160 [Planctomycetota bacterium]